jgi:hypothetical protein
MTGYNEFAKDAVHFFKSAIENNYPKYSPIKIEDQDFIEEFLNG